MSVKVDSPLLEAPATPAPSPQTRPVRSRVSAGRLGRVDALILIALAAWTAIPLALEVIYITSKGGLFSGGLAYTPQDMFQYLWWVRDSGTHVLISDPFQLVGSSQHLFLQPMFLISGLLWRLGLSLPLAYILPWAPVSVLLTFFAFRAYVRRHIAVHSAGTAALVLALFFFVPVAVIATEAGKWWGAMPLIDLDTSTTLGLCGYFPRTIAVGLLVVLLLVLERILVTAGDEPGNPSAKLVAAVTALGLTIGWLHPWQGAELVIITVGIVAWSRPARRTALALLAPAAGALVAIAYYEVLNRYDYFWRSAEAQSHRLAQLYTPLVLVIAFLPLLLAAIPGLRRRLPTDPHRRLLLLWVAASFIAYFAISSDSGHALDGVVLPLSILAVQGWQRLRLTDRLRRAGLSARRLAPAIAVLAVAVCTVPGAINWLHYLHKVRTTNQGFPAGDVAALRYLDSAPGPGGVLSSSAIAPAVPAFTGRNVFATNLQWTPNWVGKTSLNMTLYAGALGASRSQAIVTSIGARFVLVECGTSTPLPRLIAPLITAAHSFGCATVYELRP